VTSHLIGRHAQTSLASRALDGMSKEEIREGVINELLRYLDTDTTWYVAEQSPTILSY
jgi:chaperone required for assembly of F1-ATPase